MKIKATVLAALVAAELPWAGFTVTNMTFASGVTPGKNTYAGLAVPVKGEKGYYILKQK